MSLFDLPQPLGPGRHWSDARTIPYGRGFALHDKDKLLCSIWPYKRSTNSWLVSIQFWSEPRQQIERRSIELGEHETPPFEIAEALYDAMR